MSNSGWSSGWQSGREWHRVTRELLVIGLTGNIATGKTVVAAILAELGAQVIDADALAHRVMKPGTPTWRRVVAEFGTDFLQWNDEIDRTKLGACVFADAEALARLESIVHPAVIEETERLLHDLRNQTTHSAVGSKVAVIEAIKLIEAGMHLRCDELWVVTCSPEQQLKRLIENRGLSRPEAELRITAQPPPDKNVTLADVVSDNSGDLEQTREQVRREWKRIVQTQHHQDATTEGLSQGGYMAFLKQFVDKHPFLSMWALLAVGMVAIFLVASRSADLLPSQRAFMALACVLLAGVCTWIISWE